MHRILKEVHIGSKVVLYNQSLWLINTVVTLYNICSSFGLHTLEAAEDGKDERGRLLL